MKVKKHTKMLLSFALAIFIFSCDPVLANATEKDFDESTEVVLVISETDSSSETAIGYLYPKATYRSNIYGDVVADGVRLRSAPLCLRRY